MATIIITGAGRGIGLELAKQYLERGDAVVATYRSEEGRARLSTLGHGGALVAVELDVRDPAQVEALVHTVGARAVDVLVNNAGVMGPRAQGVDAMDYEAWADVLSVNLLGPFRLSTAVLASLCRSSNPRIVTLSSIMGCLSRDSSGFYAYRSSKAAVNKVMRLLAHDLEERGVIVCPVHPGWVRTEMGGERADLPVEECARCLITLIDGLTREHSGRFWRWDGAELPW